MTNKKFILVFGILLIPFLLNFISGETVLGESEILELTWIGAPCKIDSASWDKTTAYDGEEVTLKTITTGDCNNINMNFDIYKKGTTTIIPTSPKNIPIIPTTTATWTAICSGETEIIYKFDAKLETSNIGKKTSEELKVYPCKYKSCSEYLVKEICEEDLCNVGDDSIHKINPNINCNDPKMECVCRWNESATTKCTPYWTNPEGTCQYTEDLSADTNGCDDGVYSYNIFANWIGISSKPADCKDETPTINCPAQIQLPLENWLSLAGAVVAIVLIYLIFSKRKKKSEKKK